MNSSADGARAEKMRVLIVYPDSLLSRWEFLQDLAEVRCLEANGEKIQLRQELLAGFRPHVVAGIFARITPRYGLTADLMDACVNLEFVQLMAMGVDTVDVEAASQRGIAVSNLGGVGISSQSVAELTWAHILALARRIPQADAALRSGEKLQPANWRADYAFYRGGPVLWGKTLGVVGLGRIGKRTASIGRLGFNMRVIAHDPHVEPADAETLGVQLVPLDTLLAESDVIAVHATLTEETWGLIGEREIGLLKRSAIIVNTARGEIIALPALAQALEEERIAGAAIDVWPEEPPDPQEPWVQSLLRSRRTSLSPHLGSLHEAMVARHRAALENIARFCRGARPLWVVNPQVFRTGPAV